MKIIHFIYYNLQGLAGILIRNKSSRYFGITESINRLSSIKETDENGGIVYMSQYGHICAMLTFKA